MPEAIMEIFLLLNISILKHTLERKIKDDQFSFQNWIRSNSLNETHMIYVFVWKYNIISVISFKSVNNN